MQSYRLVLTARPRAVVERLRLREPDLCKRVLRVLDDLTHDPYEGKPLKGEFKGLYSYRVGSYRVIYQIYKRQLVVLVIDIGHHRDIYRL